MKYLHDKFVVLDNVVVVNKNCIVFVDVNVVAVEVFDTDLIDYIVVADHKNNLHTV